MQANQSFIYGNVFAVMTVVLGFIVMISMMAGSNIGLFLLGLYVVIVGFVMIYLVSVAQRAYIDFQKEIINKPRSGVSVEPKFVPQPKTQVKPKPKETVLPMPSAKHEPYYYSDTNVEDLPPYMY